MRPAPCARLFEVEAIRDGRLAGAERASFERHATTCPACAREVEALEALAKALREEPSESVDDLHVRRERTRLLAAFNRELLSPLPPRLTDLREVISGALLPLAALLALAAVALVIWRTHRGSEPAPSVLASRAVIHADGSAAWSERVEGNRDVVVLEHGALWLHVDHRASALRLVVVLPDGELEDTGTTFSVRAEGGRTERVAVEEGSVVLRVRGQAPVALGSGEIWTPAPTTIPPAAYGPAAPPEAPPPPFSSSATTRATAPPRAAPPLPSAPPPSPSVDFRDAMTSFDRGDACGAAPAFARLIDRYPRDLRAEDAAYLRVLALQRCGDGSGTRAAALEYLRRYPTGFRHTEVEALTR